MFNTVKSVCKLVLPYGRRKLVSVIILVVLQALVQVASVVGIFPFLSFAANPEVARQSGITSVLLSVLPSLSDHDLLALAGISAIFFLVANSVLSLTCSYVSSRYLAQLGRWIRTNLLRQIIKRDHSYFLQSSSGVIIKKVNGDARAVVARLLGPLLNIASNVMPAIFITAAVVALDPIMAAVAAVFITVFYSLVFKIFSSWRGKATEVRKETDRQASRLVHQLLGAVKVIKMHGCENDFVRRFDGLVARDSQLEAKQSVVTRLPRSIIEPLAMSSLIATVLVYAFRGQGLERVLPSVGVFALAAYRILPCIQMVYSSATTLSSYRYSLEEILEELDPNLALANGTHETIDSASALPLTRSVQVNDLTFDYEDSRRGLFTGLNFSVDAKSTTAIIGPTGCGKSTLVDVVLGLLKPTSGRVLVDGVDIHNGHLQSWHRSIGYVPQDIVLIDDTIEANIALESADQEIDRVAMRNACKTAQILDFIESDLPCSWKTEVGERGIRLSGGQRQRIGIARALYRKPSFLVLDEATSALDNETERRLMECIRGLDGQVTMLIIAHRLSTIQWCDKVVDLASGTPTVAPIAPTEIMRIEKP